MKQLQTNVHEVETTAELKKLINENENVMVSCGRMGPMCIPVYDIMEELEEELPNVKFAVMGFDTPEAGMIRNAPECRSFMGLPFNMYYKNEQVVAATTSIQNRDQIMSIIEDKFGN